MNMSKKHAMKEEEEKEVLDWGFHEIWNSS
jgi:hypothetical protein